MSALHMPRQTALEATWSLGLQVLRMLHSLHISSAHRGHVNAARLEGVSAL